MSPRFSLVLSTAALFLGAAVLHSEVTVPQLFSDHAVLQKGENTPVWGKASPGEKVRVSLGSQSAETTTGEDGRWRVDLNLSEMGPGPYELKIEGKNALIFTDILVGEVWVASGQSNMGWHLGNTLGAPAEIAQSANPWIREARVDVNPSGTPLDDVKIRGNKWAVAGPETTGSMGAICYYFAKKLSKELNTPVGMLHSSVGGSQIEAWISPEALDTDPELKIGKDNIRSAFAAYPGLQDKFASDLQKWIQTNSRQDKPSTAIESFAGPQIDQGQWSKVALPGKLPSGETFGSGVTWIRRTVDMPEKLANKFLYLNLPAMSAYDTVYWNGKEVGKTDGTPPSSTSIERRYRIPAGGPKGENILAIRLYNPAGVISDFPSGRFNIGNASQVLQLKGDWLARQEYSLPALSADALASYPQPPEPPPGEPKDVAGWLYNSMIHPIIPYGMRGIIWYQGEGNHPRAWQYRVALPLLIKDWRNAWSKGDFPFYWVQLTGGHKKADVPEDQTWAEMRDSMTAALATPNTGQSVTYDVGEAGEVHTSNKKDPAERLARVALAKTYGKDVVYSGPSYKSSSVEGDKIRVQFDHTDGGLVARPLPDTYVIKYESPDGPAVTKPLTLPSPGSEIQGFSICGEDGKWVWAQAKIDKDSVLVWSPEVPKPAAIRYAWTDNPTSNLYNGEGLPTVPFRTDTFPLLTEKVRYQIKETYRNP